MQTTLNKIKEHSPCKEGWEKLLNYLLKTEADDEVLELRTILESNGVEDTIWAMRAAEGKNKEIRLFAADCAELVLPIFEKEYPNDDRARKAIQAARDYANALINAEQLAAAENAAADAVWAAWAAWSAGDAARDASDAAGAAAWAAARDARDAASAARAAKKDIKPILLKYI